MIRFRSYSLLFAALLALVVQTFAIPGAAAGFVACIGSDGHFEIEQSAGDFAVNDSAVFGANTHHFEPCTDVSFSRITAAGQTERTPTIQLLTAFIAAWVFPTPARAPEFAPAAVAWNEVTSSAAREFTDTIRLTI